MHDRPGLVEWTLANLKIGCLAFGGSGRALIYQDLLVTERRWLTEREFFETLTLAQSVPGPNIVNLVAYVGYGFGGVAAAALGVAGLCLPGALIAALTFGLIRFDVWGLPDLFQGFVLGSAVLFLVFVWRLAGGLAEATPLRGRGLRDPLVWRLVLAGAVALASAVAVPLPWIIGLGLAAGILIESQAKS